MSLFVQVKKELCEGVADYGNFCEINRTALREAALDLKNDTFKMWILFSQFGHTSTDMSQKLAQEYFGIKKDSYYKAINELKEKGYLVLNEDESDTCFEYYDFYETPKATK